MMEDKIILTNQDDVETFELLISTANLQAETDELKRQIQQMQSEIDFNKDYDQKVIAAVSKRLNISASSLTINKIYELNLSITAWGEIFDEIYGIPGNLIQPSHHLYKYSLLKKNPNLQEYLPKKRDAHFLELLNDRSTSRAFEIMNEYNSENTRAAHTGDLVYWQAWLSAIGFDFQTPITEKEILSFIVQHAEGLDTEIDSKLFQQGFKAKLGPHKLATIKRRIGSLSVFLANAKWPNPTHHEEIGLLLQKLTKIYGSSKPAGKAITKDILDDMLDTCKNSLIDIRDKAVLLFAWSSGGRRRSEVTAAQFEDLTKTPEGEFTFNITHSKTDQESKGNVVPVKGRAAKALTDWITASGINEGAIFRSVTKHNALRGALSDLDINRIVKKRLKKAMYDETLFSAHSLRSGFVTEAGRRQKPLGDVMQMTTHRNVNTVMKYYQAGNITNNSAANLAD